jgi:hypothetical protein
MDVAAHQRELLGSTAAPIQEVAAPSLPGYYSEDDIMALLGVARATLRCWASRKPRQGPPRTRAGNRILYAKDAFHQWLASREKAAA